MYGSSTVTDTATTGRGHPPARRPRTGRGAPRGRAMLAGLAVLGMLLSLLATANLAHAHRGPDRAPRALHPLIFVHGGAGSGNQFATPALRFTSNGFPQDWIDVHEYDSTFSVNTRDDVYAGLDERISALLERTGADQVDVLAHSLGTTLMLEYLATPERAARVARYVNYDGRSADALPGGVPTLAVWGQGPDTREIVGATNVRFPDQAHTGVVTSPESFAAVYRFLVGAEPRTTDVVPERRAKVKVSGRASLFPQNVGVADGRLDIYRVDGRSGARLSKRPSASYPLSGDGAWGPFSAHRGAHYEFVLVREGAAQHHHYLEPFTRDDHLVRLLTSEPDSGIGALMDVGANHTALVITRNKEWWGDQGEADDVLEINGTNVVNAATAPMAKRPIGVFVFDDGSDGVTNLDAPIARIFALPFMTGVDLFVPAGDQPGFARPRKQRDPGEHVQIAVTPRGGGGARQVLNVPNWRSDEHRISVQFHEYL
jgi:pimeloyl-ACP methyl ester carboxylesterase